VQWTRSEVGFGKGNWGAAEEQAEEFAVGEICFFQPRIISKVGCRFRSERRGVLLSSRFVPEFGVIDEDGGESDDAMAAARPKRPMRRRSRW